MDLKTNLVKLLERVPHMRRCALLLMGVSGVGFMGYFLFGYGLLLLPQYDFVLALFVWAFVAGYRIDHVLHAYPAMDRDDALVMLLVAGYMLYHSQGFAQELISMIFMAEALVSLVEKTMELRTP